MNHLDELMNAFGRLIHKPQYAAAATMGFLDELIDHGVQAAQEWRTLAGRMDMREYRDLPLLMNALSDYLNNDGGKISALRDLMETISKRAREALMDWECLQEELLNRPIIDVDTVKEAAA